MRIFEVDVEKLVEGLSRRVELNTEDTDVKRAFRGRRVARVSREVTVLRWEFMSSR